MIKRSQLNSRHLIQIDEASTPVKYSCNSKVYFFDCHPEQPLWLKQLFMVCGLARRAVLDPKTLEVSYKVYLPTHLRTVYVYEKDLVADCSDNPIACPWGTVESVMKDGLMVKVGKEVDPEVVLNEIIKTLELDAVSDMQYKRRIHVMLKTQKSVVRVSYDRKPEFLVFAKRVSYAEAVEALRK
ncbi:MAG: hypothetical protein ACI808_000233 [Paraglaciecola sp.]|jgi:hypothetical protein